MGETSVALCAVFSPGGQRPGESWGGRRVSSRRLAARASAPSLVPGRSVVRGAGRYGAIGHADAVLNDLVRVAGLALAGLVDHARSALALPGRSVV